MRVGLIGTGNMGNRMGPKILAAGHDLVVHDLRVESATALRGAGAIWADSAAAVAEASEIVFTSLPTPTAIETVTFGPGGLVQSMTAGDVYVDLSTGPPPLAHKLAAAFKERGIAALDAPLSSGGVFMTVGGDRDTFDRCQPLFASMADVTYMGESGMGQVAKLVRQYVSFVGFFVEVEALLICAKAGGDVETVSRFLEASVRRSSLHERALKSVFARDFGTPETSTARLDIVAKDISLAVELARDVGAPAPAGLHTSDILERGLAQGWGRLEFWAAVQTLEQLAGSELSTKDASTS